MPSTKHHGVPNRPGSPREARPVRPNQTRDRLLDAAMYLFWERGYHATGMADLLKRARARSGSFYYFFENKAAVLEAVLDRYLESLEPVIVQPAFAAQRRSYRADLRDSFRISGASDLNRLSLRVPARPAGS